MKASLATLSVLLAVSAQGRADPGTRILLIGDSHTTGVVSSQKLATGSPGIRLDELLRLLPSVQVSTYGSCGAAAGHYLRGLKTSCGYFERDENYTKIIPWEIARNKPYPTPKISDILSEVKPDTTVVFLGSNYILETDHAVIAASVKKLSGVIRDAGSKCIWLAVIDARRVKPLSSEETRIRRHKIQGTIQAAVKDDCTFIDVSEFARYPDTGGDGLHYSSLGSVGRAEAQKFAAKSCKAISHVMFGYEDVACEAGDGL